MREVVAMLIEAGAEGLVDETDGYRWAKIRGAYRLSRRSIARIIAAIFAALLAFHTATSALTPADEALRRRAFGPPVARWFGS